MGSPRNLRLGEAMVGGAFLFASHRHRVFSAPRRCRGRRSVAVVMDSPVVRRSSQGDPLSWRMSDRCCAIGLLLMGHTFLFGMAQVLGGWPFLPPGAKASDLVGFNVAAF